ncbi:MAG: glycerol kinase GlpK [Bacillota bacterium]|nr:glycerol kinase GlpK [Bacillota bacterium]
MGKYILAIDSGTTSTRAVLFNHDCEIVGISQKETNLFFPKPGWVEQDANEIWISALTCCSEVILKSKIDVREIDSIGITNQRETTIVWDRTTGLPVYNALVWQSKQSNDICQRWKDAGYEPMIAEKTGMIIDSYFSASKIRWILKNVDGAQEKADRGELMFGTVDSWLIYKLSGQTTHVTDVSNASRTLLANIFTCEWDDTLLETLRVPKSMLPRIMPTSCEYAQTAPGLFFNQNIPICSAVGDQQAALFGQGCFEKGMVKNTYGTGGFMLMNTGNQVVSSAYGLLSTVGWKIGNEVTYALEGSIFVSGSLMKWLRDNLNVFSDTKETAKMASSVPDTAGVYVVPAFVGMGAPYWDSSCKASIVGLTLGANKNHIVRAALEAMAYQSMDVLASMEKDIGLPIRRMKVDGGACANDFLLQFQSDLMQCSVERMKSNELTVTGAAFLAGLATGFWKMDDLKVDLDVCFTPKKSKEEMSKLYSGWKKAVENCLSYEA